MMFKYYYLPCNCHTASHLVRLSFDEIDNSVYIEVISTKAYGFWYRFKNAWRHLFGFDHLIEADVIISPNQIDDFINEWQADRKRLKMT